MENRRRNRKPRGLAGGAVALVLIFAAAVLALEGGIEDNPAYIPIRQVAPATLPVGSAVLTEGFYRGRIENTMALNDSAAMFVLDSGTVSEVNFALLNDQSVLRIEGATDYNSDTKTYFVRVKRVVAGESPRDRVMAILKNPDAKPDRLIEAGKWAREHMSEYNDDVLGKLGEAAIVKALTIEQAGVKPTDYEAYFALAKKAEELLGDTAFRENYVRTGIDAYILSNGQKTPQVYYEAARKAEALLPGSQLPDLLIEEAFRRESGATELKTAADYLAIANKAKELFGEGVHYRRLLGRSLDIEYQAIEPNDYTALYALARKARDIYPDYPNFRTVVTRAISAEKAVMDPKDPEAWVRLGNRVLYFFNDKHQAGLMFRTASDLDPSSQETRSKLREMGFVYYRGNWWWAEEFGRADLFRQVQEFEQLAEAGTVVIGMSQDQVARAKGGGPAEIHVSAGGWGVTTQWVYRDGGSALYLSFMADTLVSKGEVTQQ